MMPPSFHPSESDYLLFETMTFLLVCSLNTLRKLELPQFYAYFSELHTKQYEFSGNFIELHESFGNQASDFLCFYTNLSDITKVNAVLLKETDQCPFSQVL